MTSLIADVHNLAGEVFLQLITIFTFAYAIYFFWDYLNYLRLPKDERARIREEAKDDNADTFW